MKTHFGWVEIGTDFLVCFSCFSLDNKGFLIVFGLFLLEKPAF